MENMIELDVTLFIQLANFLIAIVLLNFILIKPVREQLAQRSSLIEDYSASIESFTAEATTKISDYEAALSAARSEASTLRDALRAEGTAAEHAIVQKAQVQAQEFLQSARSDTAKEAKAAMDALLSQVNDLAATAMKKILG